MKEQNIGARPNWTAIIIVLAIVALVAFVAYLAFKEDSQKAAEKAVIAPPNEVAVSTVDFPQEGTIEKAESIEKSTGPNFWLISGQELKFTDGVTSTGDKLSLITKEEFGDSTQSVYFNVSSTNDNLKERKADNMVGMYIRYVDENNYYSFGIGADGKVKIKKVSDGEEADLHFPQRQIFPGKYDETENPNLIPTRDFGLMARVFNSPDGSVTISTFLDSGDGTWSPLEAVVDSELNPLFPDPNPNYLFPKGHGGVKNDYMNVRFRDYSIHRDYPIHP